MQHTYTKDRILDLIRQELEQADHMGKEKGNYYQVAGIVTAALEREPSPAKAEQEGLRWVKGCPRERKMYHAKYRFLKEDAEIKDGLIAPLQDTRFWEAISINCRNIIEVVQIVAYLDESTPATQPDPVEFDDAMEAEINKLPYTNHVDAGQYNDGQLAGFELGANWAKKYFQQTQE